MKIERQLAPIKCYGGKRSKNDIVYIVLQDIDNKPLTHYRIIEGQAIQKIPDDYVSDAVNGPRFSRNGYLHGICTKYNSISIGIPDHMTEDDVQTCLHLIMTIKQRYKVHNDCIIRKTDVTGEINPESLFDNDRWKADIKDKLIEI